MVSFAPMVPSSKKVQGHASNAGGECHVLGFDESLGQDVFHECVEEDDACVIFRAEQDRIALQYVEGETVEVVSLQHGACVAQGDGAVHRVDKSYGGEDVVSARSDLRLPPAKGKVEIACCPRIIHGDLVRWRKSWSWWGQGCMSETVHGPGEKTAPPGFAIDRDEWAAGFCGDFFVRLPEEEVNEAACRPQGISSLLQGWGGRVKFPRSFHLWRTCGTNDARWGAVPDSQIRGVEPTCRVFSRVETPFIGGSLVDDIRGLWGTPSVMEFVNTAAVLDDVQVLLCCAQGQQEGG